MLVFVVHPPSSSALCPYTTLFRSPHEDRGAGHQAGEQLIGPQTAAQQEDHAHHGEQDPAADPGDLVPARGDRKSTPSELQSRGHLVCRLLLEKKKNNI